MKNERRKGIGFTIIELIVVVSVISILMSLLVPGAQKVLLRSRKSNAQSYMKQIASMYCSYYTDNGYIPDVDDNRGVSLAEKFAESEYLNNANIYVYPGDSSAAGVLQETIWPIENDIHAWETGKKLSVVLVGNITRDVDTSTTPIAYTRGYSSETCSWTKDSPYGTDGGFVAFLDGNVRWFTNTSGLLSIDSGEASDLEAVITNLGGKCLDTDT